jgi:hypothetical protein
MIRIAVFDADKHYERFDAVVPSNSTQMYILQTIDQLRCEMHNRVYDGWINVYDTEHSTLEPINQYDL